MEKLISFLDLRRMKSDPRPGVLCAERTAGLAASGAGPLRTEVRGQQRPAPHPQMVPGTGSEVGGGGSATEALLARLFCLGPPLGAAVPDQAGRGSAGVLGRRSVCTALGTRVRSTRSHFPKRIWGKKSDSYHVCQVLHTALEDKEF